MKILFSPSESKTTYNDSGAFCVDSFIFPALYEERIFVLHQYSDFIKSANLDHLSALFGTNNQNLIEKYRADIFSTPTSKAIQRYSGVAFSALDYSSLDEKARGYIDENVVIFSNLFGPILASNHIPNYKLKQGQKIGNFATEGHYLAKFSSSLDDWLNGEEILDLRAKFYEKFYRVKEPYLTMKFQKNGKIISHFAKHYRGQILRTIAQNRLTRLDDILGWEYENLQISNIKIVNNKKEITYAIVEI